MEADRFYIFQILQSDTADLLRQFNELDLSIPKTDTSRGTDIVYYEMSFTANYRPDSPVSEDMGLLAMRSMYNDKS
jgi:hypothetical protein